MDVFLFTGSGDEYPAWDRTLAISALCVEDAIEYMMENDSELSFQCKISNLQWLGGQFETVYTFSHCYDS